MTATAAAQAKVTLRYRQKAAVVLEAWAKVVGGLPTRKAVVHALAIGELESRLGDAWPGHNWGAVQKRSLTSREAETLAARGIFPSGGDAARKAAAAVLPAARDELLWIDRNTKGPYFVWFWAFESDAAAAERFLVALVKQRAGVRAVLAAGTAEDVARAMYASHYYGGVSEDPEVNIQTYARAIRSNAGPIEAALAGWDGSLPAGGTSRWLLVGAAAAAVALVLVVRGGGSS